MRLCLDKKAFLCANTDAQGVPDGSASRPEGSQLSPEVVQTQRSQCLTVPILFELSVGFRRSPVDGYSPDDGLAARIAAANVLVWSHTSSVSHLRLRRNVLPALISVIAIGQIGGRLTTPPAASA